MIYKEIVQIGINTLLQIPYESVEVFSDRTEGKTAESHPNGPLLFFHAIIKLNQAPRLRTDVLFPLCHS